MPKTNEHKLAQYVANGNAWQHPYKVINCLCFDGKRRTVRLNQQADTFFSWTGRCTILGKTVRGYVTSIETDGKPDSYFHISKVKD